MIDMVMQATNDYIAQMPKAQRKKYGQFFTSKNTAVYMAGLFALDSSKHDISILDAGAGSGILSAALVERFQNAQWLKRIRLVCYENDPNVIDLLKQNLTIIQENSAIPAEVEIREDNYILSQTADYNGMLDANPNPEKFDLIIGNPPYKKIGKDAPEALSMSDVCYGAPNLYFLFASMGLFNLKDNAEMVYIIPRSWTSGAYFRQFREKFLREGALEHIHLFESRDKVFSEENVLQETIIVKVRKTALKPETITITSTDNSDDFSHARTLVVPYSTVVSGPESYVYLVTDEEEASTLNRLNRLQDTLPSLGLRMKTGLTVDFRNWEALRDSSEDGTVPLFYAQHIQEGKVVFPVGKEHEYIMTNQPGLLQRNTNYLFVKRFTSKEEHRRLQCGVYLAKQHPGYSVISTQNKINFISGLKELSEHLVYGLYVLFNSTIYDCYYRILNGSTQVNSTEINSMPVPPMSTIEAMGEELIKTNDMSEFACDRILRSYI